MHGHKLGLYGGTFDPIHIGHLIIARSVRENLQLDEVVFVPSAQPPHKDARELSPFEDRAAMVELAVAGEAGFSIDRWEGQRSGPSYTLLTVQHFRERFPDLGELCWIIGADSLSELSTWHRVADLVRACRVVTAGRPGWELPDLSALEDLLGAATVEGLQRDVLPTPLCEIASRDIRARAAAGQSIRYLVPEAVREYIHAHGLYGAGTGCEA